MMFLLPWLLPPLVGAAIGYLTNAVAIKMLFRPLKEIRLFAGKGGKGIKLPFTPGILPRERHKLASSIGAMVERELLTEEIVRERLRRESVRETVRNSIGALTANLLRLSPAELFRAEPQGAYPALSALTEAVWPRLVDSLTAFLGKPDIRRELEGQGKKLVETAMDELSVFQRFFVEAGNYDTAIQERMPRIVDDFIRRMDTLLRDGKMRGRVLSALGEEGSQGLGELLNLQGEVKEGLDRLIADRLFEAVDRQIGPILSTLDIKTMVEERIDSLEMIRVEKIVLDVMANQFTWINLFGGILGALIGFFQALLSHFMARV
ncbi:MAG: DUF445 family protein [Spirochaetaceae bacterium]|jgi:uncharacterized membrane protein YheB (UPF0754 family)|nr:DUF445 family protein [Spirochaetaceae bacterium]